MTQIQITIHSDTKLFTINALGTPTATMSEKKFSNDLMEAITPCIRKFCEDKNIPFQDFNNPLISKGKIEEHIERN